MQDVSASSRGRQTALLALLDQTGDAPAATRF